MFPSLYGVVSQGAAAASWWVVAGKTCVAAYQPIGAASLAASYINLANPGTYDAAPGVAPTWASATGWTGNGITTFLKTGIVPANDQTWSYLVRFSGATTGSYRLLMGNGVAAANAFLACRWTTGVTYSHGAWRLNVGAVLEAGVMAIAGRSVYRNGATDGADLGAGAVAATPIYLLAAYDTADAGRNWLIGNIQAVAIYSDTLSGAEVATLSAAMAALT